MRKGKKPDEGKTPRPNNDPGVDEEFEPQTQEKAALVPPSRRPPTAVGAATPPRPPRPSRSTPSASDPHRRPIVFHLLHDLRAAIGTLLEVADIVADAITKRLRGEA